MKRQEKITEVSAYNAKTRQAELFRRAPSGEVFLMTNNGKLQVEIRQATIPQARIVDAVKALALLQSKQLQAGRAVVRKN